VQKALAPYKNVTTGNLSLAVDNLADQQIAFLAAFLVFDEVIRSMAGYEFTMYGPLPGVRLHWSSATVVEVARQPKFILDGRVVSQNEFVPTGPIPLILLLINACSDVFCCYLVNHYSRNCFEDYALGAAGGSEGCSSIGRRRSHGPWQTPR